MQTFQHFHIEFFVKPRETCRTSGYNKLRKETTSPSPLKRVSPPPPPGRGRGGTNSCFKNPPFTNPCFTNPPFTTPCFTNPSFTNPCFTNPPFTNPCFTNPPFTNPPFTNHLLQIHPLKIHVLKIQSMFYKSNPIQSTPSFTICPWRESMTSGANSLLMTLRVAQFSLKIAHLSFSMVLRGPRACGLRPRLWLLINDI